MNILDDTVVLDNERKTAVKGKLIKDAPSGGFYETVIIGGGPAGITSGIYLGRKRVETLMITPELGGQVSWTSNVENYPGYDVISGFDLSVKFREQLEMQSIDMRLGDNVETVKKYENGGGVIKTLLGGEYEFKTLIIASGKKSSKLGVPGEKEFYGRGVTYCSTCDGPLYRGENVAVIGGGNSALTTANDLIAQGCKVSIVNVLPGIQADPVLLERADISGAIKLFTNYKVFEITGKNTVDGIKISNNETGEEKKINVTGVFIEIGLAPNSDFADGIVALNEKKEILVNCRCETNVPGIFAAGDVTNVPEKQIIIAAGEGAKAALSAYDYLLRGK